MSSTRARIVLALILLLAGFFAVPFLRRAVPTEEAWQAQIVADAETALQVLAPDERLPAELVGEEWAEFWDRWHTRLELYDEPHRQELRRRLHRYLDFLEIEYEGAAEIYVGAPAVRPRDLSQAARDARAAIVADFGALGAEIVADADELREDAYEAAPGVAGIDPDLPDYRREHERILDWLPRARARADQLTERPGSAAPERR